jgi:hypothetical protein
MYLNPRHFGSVRRGIDGRRQSRLRKEMQLSGWDTPLRDYKLSVSKFSVSVERCYVYLTTET